MQQSLQDLGLMVNGSGDASLILDTLLQGLHRGVGLERVMVAVLADQQSRFKVRCAIGEEPRTGSRASFCRPISPSSHTCSATRCAIGSRCGWGFRQATTWRTW